jgi:hypothetical protein
MFDASLAPRIALWVLSGIILSLLIALVVVLTTSATSNESDLKTQTIVTKIAFGSCT